MFSQNWLYARDESRISYIHLSCRFGNWTHAAGNRFASVQPLRFFTGVVCYMKTIAMSGKVFTQSVTFCGKTLRFGTHSFEEDRLAVWNSRFTMTDISAGNIMVLVSVSGFPEELCWEFTT